MYSHIPRFPDIFNEFQDVVPEVYLYVPRIFSFFPRVPRVLVLSDDVPVCYVGFPILV